MFSVLRSVEISPGGYSESKALAPDVLEERAGIIRAAKNLRPSLSKVSFDGLGMWYFDEGKRWTFEDYWRTTFSKLQEEH